MSIDFHRINKCGRRLIVGREEVNALFSYRFNNNDDDVNDDDENKRKIAECTIMVLKYLVLYYIIIRKRA